MAADLSMPVDVVGCPIVREPDGLAMSSRNVYLSPAQRAAAPVLFEALSAAAAAVAAGERSVAAVESVVADRLAAEPEAQLDYAALVDPLTLEPAQSVTGEQRFLVAARFGTTRLLDNLATHAPDPPRRTSDHGRQRDAAARRPEVGRIDPRCDLYWYRTLAAY